MEWETNYAATFIQSAAQQRMSNRNRAYFAQKCFRCISYLAMFPINAIIAKLSGISGLTAQLSFSSSLILILLSIGITILGGWIPAKNAAKKDPVVALRTE